VDLDGYFRAPSGRDKGVEEGRESLPGINMSRNIHDPGKGQRRGGSNLSTSITADGSRITHRGSPTGLKPGSCTDWSIGVNLHLANTPDLADAIDIGVENLSSKTPYTEHTVSVFPFMSQIAREPIHDQKVWFREPDGHSVRSAQYEGKERRR